MADNNTRYQLESRRERRIPLDFAPFEAALAALTPDRAAWLDALLVRGTIHDVQAACARGETTSVELVTYFVDRIRRFDDRLNSVVEVNPNAPHIAAALDAERNQGGLRGPLHGIPVLLKDNIDTGDRLQSTAGSAALMGTFAPKDAFLVERLREAGAIILGKNNLSEWAFWMSDDAPSGYSYRGGQTRSPYGPFDVGGSSSGSGASIAATLAMVSVGSETSGSLVSPASKNSLVTLKPSIGLVSRSGMTPIVDAMDTAGPLARTVVDAAALLSALAAAPDPADPYSEAAASLAGTDFTAKLDVNALRGKRVGLWRVGTEMPEDATDEQKADIQRESDLYHARLEAVRPLLERAGAICVPLPAMPDVPWHAVKAVLFAGFRHCLNAYLASRGVTIPLHARTLADIIAFNQADEAERAPYNQALLIQSNESMADMDAYRAAEASARVSARQLLDAVFADYELDWIASVDYALCGIYSPAGYPAGSVPGGYSDEGEPFALTLVGRFLDDARLLGALYAFEQANLLRRPPPMP